MPRHGARIGPCCTAPECDAGQRGVRHRSVLIARDRGGFAIAPRAMLWRVKSRDEAQSSCVVLTFRHCQKAKQIAGFSRLSLTLLDVRDLLPRGFGELLRKNGLLCGLRPETRSEGRMR